MIEPRFSYILPVSPTRLQHLYDEVGLMKSGRSRWRIATELLEVRIQFRTATDRSAPTSFRIDEVSVS